MGKFWTFQRVLSSSILLGMLIVPAAYSSAGGSSLLSQLQKKQEEQKKQQEEAKKKAQAQLLKIVSSFKNHWGHHHHPHRHPSNVVPVPTPPAGACSTPFTETVSAAKISKHHIYIDLKALNFLKSQYGFWLEDVDLEITYKDKTKQIDIMTLALNGIKASQPGGYINNWKLKGSGSCANFKMHRLLSNGIEPFDRLLLRLKKNQGLLKISVLGRHSTSNIVDVKLIFKGRAFVACNPGTTTTTTTLPNTGTSTTTTTTSTTSTTTSTTTTTTTLPPEDLSKYQIRIDTVNPSANPTASTNMQITFSSDSSDGTYWCSVDQATFDKCQSPVNLAGLSNGDHQFQVYAVTPRGVVASDPVGYTWTVDRIAPTVQITNLNDLSGLTNQVSITFQVSSSKSGTFKCSLDGVQAQACVSPMSYTVLTEGQHNFSVWAIDKVGNISGQPAQFNWTLDLTAPVASIAAVEPNEDLSRNPNRTISFAANETSNFECALDDGGFGPCESPLELADLAEGSHNVQIRATDLAGNIGSIVTHSWTLDFTAPEISVGAVNPAQGLTNALGVSVDWSLNEAGQTYCQWDSMDPVVCSSPFTANFDEDGSHHLSLWAIDTVGNRSAKTILNWSSDRTAPMISFGSIEPSAATYLSVNSVRASLVLSESLTWSASLNDQTLQGAQNPIDLSGLNDGEYTLSVSGFDAAGNLSNVISHSFVIDTRAPQISISADGGTLINRDSRTLSFSSNEDVTYQCSLNGAGFEACQNPDQISGLADGDHTLIVRATDRAGNQTVISDSWKVDTKAPSTLLSANQVESAITFSMNSDESPVTYLCSMDGSVDQACESPVAYTGLATGSHSFKVKAVDAAGNVDASGASYNFTVYPAIQTTITASNPSASLVSTRAMSISFSANQPVSGFVCSRDGLAFAACSSPVSYSGLADGNHSFTVKAVDLNGQTEATGASKTWTVDGTAPTITSFTTTSNSNSITVTWFLSEPGTAKITYGVGSNMNQATVETTTTATSYSIKLTGLSSNTLYSIQVSGKDAAGNTYTGNVQTARTSR